MLKVGKNVSSYQFCYSEVPSSLKNVLHKTNDSSFLYQLFISNLFFLVSKENVSNDK